jgi:hypothetical protein
MTLKDIKKKMKQIVKYGIITSYPAPINIVPTSWIDALGNDSENSCLRIASAECINDHL